MWAGEDSNLRRLSRRVYSPFPLAARAPTQTGEHDTILKLMPTFDVVSRLDMQEVRNAVDQAAREVSTRYDFRNTGTAVVLGDGAITLNSSTEDRLAAARQVLEEKLVRRKVSLKALDYGKVQEAAGATVRQVAGLRAADLVGPVPRAQQVHQGPRHQRRAIVHPGRTSYGCSPRNATTSKP